MLTKVCIFFYKTVLLPCVQYKTKICQMLGLTSLVASAGMLGLTSLVASAGMLGLTSQVASAGMLGLTSLVASAGMLGLTSLVVSAGMHFAGCQFHEMLTELKIMGESSFVATGFVC